MAKYENVFLEGSRVAAMYVMGTGFATTECDGRGLRMISFARISNGVQRI
jgi:hypothetical protein